MVVRVAHRKADVVIGIAVVPLDQVERPAIWELTVDFRHVIERRLAADRDEHDAKRIVSGWVINPADKHHGQRSRDGQRGAGQSS